MLRLRAFALAVPMILACGLAAGQDARVAWLYQKPDGFGSFRRGGGGRWVEINPEGAAMTFAEAGRTPAFVELFDRSRGFRVRLGADRAELQAGEGADWNPLVDGRWVSPADLPPVDRGDTLIRLAYFVPADRAPAAEYADRIRVVMQFVAEVYRQDFAARKVRTPGLRFQVAGGKPVVHLVRGAHPAAFYSGAPSYDGMKQWNGILAEIPKRVADPSRELLVVFAETYDAGPAPFEWPGGVALGTRIGDGGVGLFSAWILRPEFCATTIERQKALLLDDTPIAGRTALGHGGKDSPRYEFVEDGFGAVAHELGHALGLPHDSRRDDLDIMGNGFRNLRENFRPRPDPQRRVRFSDENARILSASRFLAADGDPSDRLAPAVEARLAAPPKAGASQVRLAVVAEDEGPLRALLVFAPGQDSVVAGRALKGRRQAVELVVPVKPLQAGPFRLVVSVADAGGNVSQAEVEGIVE